jgi:hypothetical protein
VATFGDLGAPYHWGIAVRDIDRAAATWSSMPGCGTFAVMDFEVDATFRGRPSHVVGRIGYAPLGTGGYVELVQPISGEWTAATWLAERGESPYHIGYWCDDVGATLGALDAQRVDTVAFDDAGTMFAYVDTVAELGVHTELVRGSLKPFLTGWIAGVQPP